MRANASPHRDRLWTPWRMRYIAGGTTEDGCIFCNRLARQDDIESLILHRADHCFVIMNLFPYNTGHLMIVPHAHSAEIDRLEPQVLTEMACLLPPVVRALRRVLGCDGFNIGFNQGAIAGAGVAEHLHQHVVPRWEGDANFMPILAGTMVIPELIPSTYAKIRAEFDAELHGATVFEVVILDTEDDPAVWLHFGRFPSVSTSQGNATWQSVIQELGLGDAEFVGYSGSIDTRDRTATPGVVLRTTTSFEGAAWRRYPLFDAQRDPSLEQQTRDTLQRAIASLRPWIGSGPLRSSTEGDPVD